ncbi:hypothetical protein [Thalassobaculum litoreum]|uniref:Uncharacterized protein n=1 Tax=Thalassobaculum litoreum DSM 18839 TaxID=1123362 RepID=A0A8G2BI39_9PROT|nr:hypothetical protein [Thalassobaculum litoreum]SDF84195.1 hypothetical protein SAMN05660686_02500 [Thalassobaculum litoreum DSM 18839]
MSIDAQAKLIAGLAETMSDRDWADNTLRRCAMIREAVKEIERIATQRLGGER